MLTLILSVADKLRQSDSQRGQVHQHFIESSMVGWEARLLPYALPWKDRQMATRRWNSWSPILNPFGKGKVWVTVALLVPNCFSGRGGGLRH